MQAEVLALLLTHCVHLGIQETFSGPQFPSLLNGISGTYCAASLGAVRDYKKHLIQEIPKKNGTSIMS